MTGQSQKSDKPTIALAIGDPAGIGVELTARLIADPEIRSAANVIVVGDRRVLEQGHREAGLAPDFDIVATP
ncbi:MAG: 4-hydroxythreonine-4-phosphate dehydrogenase, partial [Alphaproteobacteria bacterium]|nr:4-hydroxythreonine-4-phosphate dehydrogenase [Alphaproteobacteria bacterium]